MLPGKRTFTDADIVQVLSESLDAYAQVCDKYADLTENEKMVLLQTSINMVGKRDIAGGGLLGLPGAGGLQ